MNDIITCTLAAALLSAAISTAITWTCLHRRQSRIEKDSWNAARLFYTRRS